MALLQAGLALASALTGVELTPANSSTPNGFVDGALPGGGRLWTRQGMIVRAAGAIITAFSEPGIDEANGGVLVSLAGGAVGGSTVAQGDPQADATKGWPVRIFNATGALLGRLAAAGSLPVALSTEDAAKVPSLGTAVMTGSTPVTIATNDTQTLALLAQLVLAVAALGKIVPSGSQTPITPSDSDPVNATCSQGLLVTSIGGGATLVTRGATTTGTSVTQTVVAGQFVPGAFSRVMVATTCTVIGYAP